MLLLHHYNLVLIELLISTVLLGGDFNIDLIQVNTEQKALENITV